MAAVVGNVHAQPLYIEGGPNGPMIIVVTAFKQCLWSRFDAGHRHSHLVAHGYWSCGDFRFSVRERKPGWHRLALQLSISRRGRFSFNAIDPKGNPT